MGVTLYIKRFKFPNEKHFINKTVKFVFKSNFFIAELPSQMLQYVTS